MSFNLPGSNATAGAVKSDTSAAGLSSGVLTKSSQNGQAGTNSSNGLSTSGLALDIQNNTIIEIAQKWTKQIRQHEKQFKKAAREVKEWDDFLLVMNGEVDSLSQGIATQVSQLDELNHGLDTMKQMHLNLEQELRTTEKDLDRRLGEIRGQRTAADFEREKNYNLAQEVDKQVSSIFIELQELVQKLNQSQENRDASESEFVQIEQIVDMHQRSLEYIDQKTTEISQGLGVARDAVASALSSGSNNERGGNSDSHFSRIAGDMGIGSKYST